MIVSLDPQNLKKLEEAAAKHGVPIRIIGTVAPDALTVSVQGELLIQEKTSALQAVWQEAIPCIMK